MKNDSPNSLKPFFWVAIAWLVFAVALSWRGGREPMAWAAGLWALSSADLWAITKLVSTLLKVSSGSDISVENRTALVIHASYWALIKLACLLLLSLVLFKSHGIPATSLFTGLGTLIAVPLLGGWFWSRKTVGALDHA